MISFDLACVCGFQFEGWFQCHGDFTDQINRGLVECPGCKCNQIHKVLSPVSIRRSGPRETVQVPSSDSSMSTEVVIRAISEYVEKNFENVGANLAEKALKMRYGVEETRNIRGVASSEEEKMLKKEGIDLLKVPVFSKDGGNDDS
jgi:hypothetical protein